MTDTIAPPQLPDLDTRGTPTAAGTAHRPVPVGHPARRGRFARLVRGGDADQRWARPLLLALLLLTAVAYLWNLSSSGYANDFYAAAVKSGTESWKAWLFGSLDSGNSITVDKPPASLWAMVLSARIFGFSSFSMLLPQALMGVGTVTLLHAAVRRTSGHAAGLLAGTLVLLTPVAALMFRFNNPDAMLVLLMAGAAYFVVRAIEPAAPMKKSHALRWLLLAGTAIGFAFLAKMMQGLLVLPAFGLVYLVASPHRLVTRIWHLLAAAGAVIVAAGWFVALVALWPASTRPYIGGSTDNSLWELAIGYNGLGRLFGESDTGNGGGGASFGGASGLTRMFGTAFGSQISWLIPAALIALIAGLWCTRRAPRTDPTRAGILLWGGWLLVTMVVLSYMQGTVHPYYSVALAPAIGGLLGITGRELWRGRASHLARLSLSVMIAATAAWSWYLLDRDAASWLPWLRWTVLIGGILGSAVLAVSVGTLKKYAVIALLVGSITALGGTAAYTVATIDTAHTGSTPTAGPAVAGSSTRGGFGGGTGGERPSGTFPGGAGAGTPPSGATPGSTTTNAALVTLLDNTTSRWSAAVVGAQSASGYILSTATAVMGIGGFSGSDDSPTLAQFQAYVAAGDIRYFISGGSQGGGAGGQSGTTSSASAITAWVTAHYTATTVGGVTVYDLSTATS